MGKILITIGILLIIGGAAIEFGNRIPWFGRLPGDVSMSKGNVKIYAPITTSILLSILISLIIYLISRFKNS